MGARPTAAEAQAFERHGRRLIRAVANNVPVWALVLLFVGGALAISLLSLRLFTRIGLRSANWEADSMVSGFANRGTTLFAILLAFTIVSEFNHIDSADTAVASEAAALAQFAGYADTLAPAARNSMRSAVATYGNAVVHKEFASLHAGGQPGRAASVALADLRAMLHSEKPKGASQTAFYNQAVTALSDLETAGRERTLSAVPAVPPELLILLLLGSIVFLTTMVLVSATKDRLLIVLTVGISVLVGAGLLAVVMFDYPFSGFESISTAPYHTGALQGLVR